jgi:hypothetical protein
LDILLRVEAGVAARVYARGAEQVADGAVWVLGRCECVEQEGCADGVPERAVGLAVSRELGDGTGELMAVQELGEVVALLAGVGEAGEAEGVDQADRLDGRAPAVKESPVDANIVADNEGAVEAAGEFRLDIGDGGCVGEGAGGQAGGDPGPPRNSALRVDEVQ